MEKLRCETVRILKDAFKARLLERETGRKIPDAVNGDLDRQNLTRQSISFFLFHQAPPKHLPSSSASRIMS